MLYILTHKAEKQLSNCSDSHRFGPLSCEKFKLSTTTCSSVVPAPLGDSSVLKHCAASLVRVKLTQFIQVMIIRLVLRCHSGGCNVISDELPVSFPN